MEDFLDQKLRTRTTLSDLAPVSLGKVLRSTTTRGDLLAEMRDDDRL